MTDLSQLPTSLYILIILIVTLAVMIIMFITVVFQGRPLKVPFLGLEIGEKPAYKKQRKESRKTVDSDQKVADLPQTDLPSVGRVEGSDLGKGVRIGGRYQNASQDLKLVSSDWARWQNAGWVKSGWFYNPPDSDLSHAVAFFKTHCFDDGRGYVHVLSVSGSWHELWLRTNTGSSQRHRFIYSDPKRIKSEPEAVDDLMVRWPFTWKEPNSQ